ncbi:hypothetical protein VJ923_07205 [Adlercreutzia sp. R25]|uniref:hypothetical protein n=1 Tax=Adlercreutzia shanghongiae TaxID=3111773 RepID=UPI002DBE5B81|nr:hypothetical protein [Adlercreutzia sp. R25]MEC4272941.1 hypothetical protein [Adlercreutzia sp. R25]
MSPEDTLASVWQIAEPLSGQYAEACIATSAIRIAAIALALAAAAIAAAATARKYEEWKGIDESIARLKHLNAWSRPLVACAVAAVALAVALTLALYVELPKIAAWAGWPEARMLNELIQAVGR